MLKRCHYVVHRASHEHQQPADEEMLVVTNIEQAAVDGPDAGTATEHDDEIQVTVHCRATIWILIIMIQVHPR